jgi:hypothetical protein
MYTERARQMRLCRGVTKRGTACQQFAMWDHEEQLCVQHAGLGHHGPQQRRDRWPDSRSSLKRHRRPQAVCRCGAYNWPHRPAAGACSWPDAPVRQHPTPASTHRWPRLRRS